MNDLTVRNVCHKKCYRKFFIVRKSRITDVVSWVRCLVRDNRTESINGNPKSEVVKFLLRVGLFHDRQFPNIFVTFKKGNIRKRAVFATTVFFSALWYFLYIHKQN